MTVTAVIVAADLRYLSQTLTAVGEQTSRPDRTIVLDVTDLGEELSQLLQELELADEVEVHHAVGAKNLGVAVNELLSSTEIDARWLWILHDDSPPAPGALTELIRATATARMIGIAGCKQVRIDDPSRLVSVGVKHTRSARRVTQIDFDEIDQGQYDDREDVYAVGTAGMFIRYETWVALGGPDPQLGPFLDGADLSRRARLAGERVIVVPTAVVRHARASLWHGPERHHTTADGAHSFLPRRVSTLHFRLVSANAWMLPLVVLGMLFAAVGRALWRISTNDIPMAWQELRAPLIALSRIRALHRSRRAVARTTTTSRGVLAPLYVTRSEFAKGWWHTWRANRVARRRQVAPSELEIAEKQTITRRRRLTFATVLIVTTAMGGLLLPKVSLGSILDLPVLAGGALDGVDQSYLTLWERGVSGWSAAGDGMPMAPHPFGLILAALATLTGGPLGVPAHVSINLLLLLGIPLAAISAWFAAGGLTRSVLLRAFAALAWAFVPALTTAINHGRISAVLAHILLPLFPYALARAFGVDRRDVIRSGMDGAGEGDAARWVLADSTASGTPSAGAAAAAGILMAAIAASAPILLPALVLLVAGIAVFVGSGRLRMVLVGLPALVLFIPTFVAAVQRGWSFALRSIDTAPVNLTFFDDLDATGLELSSWHLLIGMPEHPDSYIPAAAVAGALALTAISGLFRTGTAGRAARLGVAGAGLGALTAALASHVLRAPQYDWLGSFQRLPEWSGPGASFTVAGMLIAAIAGVTGAGRRVTRRSFSLAHIGVGVAGMLLVGIVGAGGLHTTTGLLQEPQWQMRGTEPLPALARQTVVGPDQGRVLMMAPTENAIVTQLWRGNGTQLVDPHFHFLGEDEAADELATLGAELMAGSAEEVGQILADHAVAFVLTPSLQSPYVAIDPFSREELLAALDGRAELERVTDSEVGTMWRVKEPAARVRILQGEHVTAVPSGVITADTPVPELPSPEAGRIVLAERADPGWRATLNGEILADATNDWHQAFELPADARGELHITHSPLPHRIWQAAAAVLFFFVTVLALPVRRRPEVPR